MYDLSTIYKILFLTSERPLLDRRQFQKKTNASRIKKFDYFNISFNRFLLIIFQLSTYNLVN